MFLRTAAILISIFLFAEVSGQEPVLAARGPGYSLFSIGTPHETLYEPQSVPVLTAGSPPMFGHSGLSTTSFTCQSCPPVSAASSRSPSCPPVCETPVCEPVSCEPCVCSPCDCSPCNERGRRYALDVGVALLTRSRPDGGALFVNPATLTENISAGSLQADSTVALDTGLILYEQHHLTDLEFRALWVDDFKARATQQFTGNVVQFNGNPPVGTTGPRTGTVNYATDFFSTEANLRFRSPQKCRGRTWVLGARVMILDDLLSGEFADPAGVLPNENIRISTQNDLVGVHFGADSILKNSSRWCLKWSWRTGLYGNDNSQNSQLISLATPPVAFPASGSGGKVAWHAEGAVSGKFRLSKCANLFASYRLMYLDGLVLAPDQLAATNFLAQRGLDDDGSLWLQSATLGLELAY